MGGIIDPPLEPQCNVIIPFAARWPDAEKRDVGIHNVSLVGHDVGIGPPGPFPDIDFLQAGIGRRVMAIPANMFGDNRQRLQCAP